MGCESHRPGSSELALTHLNDNIGVFPDVLIPIRISAPTRCNTVAIILQVICIFERRVAWLPGLASRGSKQEKTLSEHPTQAKLVVKHGDLKHPFENRTRPLQRGQAV